MKRDWTSRTALLLIGLILVVVNLIALNLFARMDLTDDGVYSLSDASIDLVENLDDPVTITAFFTKDLPTPYSTNRRFLKDKLDDYRAYGGTNIQYRFVDPADDEEARTDAGRYGIPPVQIQVIESDNVQLKNAYMGLGIQYGGERETIPVVEDLSTLEYDITSSIRRLTRDELPVVGVVSGHGEPALFQDLATFNQALQRNYTVRSVTLDDSLDTALDALLVIAPTDTLPPAHLRRLDDYVMRGGRLGLLLNRVNADLQTGQGMELSVGLEPVLSTYGIAVAPNLIMDEQSSVVTVQRQQGMFSIAQQIEYPLFPVATRFNPDNMMVNGLRDVMFYYVSSIDTSLAVPDGVTVEPLILSSPRSGLQQGFFMLQPMMQQNTARLSGGPYVLAAAYTGTFPSAFVPNRTSTPTRMAVVGDGDFLTESIVRNFPGNIALGLNLVDWLAQDDALLAIRTKNVAPRALGDFPEGLQPWIKYGNMIGPALLVILFGLLRWRRRKQRHVVLATP